MSLRRKLSGLNYVPKLRLDGKPSGVEERITVGRSITERICGRSNRENAGMSSESKVRIFTVENLRFPGEGSSSQGKSGPKPRLKSVGDGQQVDIPVPPIHRLNDGGTQEDRVSALLDMRVQAVRLSMRQIPLT